MRKRRRKGRGEVNLSGNRRRMLVLMGGRPQGLFWFWRGAEGGGADEGLAGPHARRPRTLAGEGRMGEKSRKGK